MCAMKFAPNNKTFSLKCSNGRSIIVEFDVITLKYLRCTRSEFYYYYVHSFTIVNAVIFHLLLCTALTVNGCHLVYVECTSREPYTKKQPSGERQHSCGFILKLED